MKFKHTLGACLALTLASFMPAAFTAFDPVNDDTDIFLANPTYNVQRPNVLIILDNTANWNTAFEAEKTALVDAVNSLNDSFNVGLMMFTETGTGNTGNDGAYVKFAVRQMTTANKAVLTGMVTALHINDDKSNGGKTALAMYEAYQYYAGAAAYAGATKVKRDYAGNASNTAGSLAGNALTSSTATTYVSPIVDGCQKNFIIYISNGPAQDNASDLTTSETRLRTLNGGTTPTTITLNPTGSQDNWADEWARYMATADCNTTIAGMQNVVTYTLDVGPAGASGGQGPGWTALLKSMATIGKGKYFAIDSSLSASSTTSAIATALNTIFSEVQAVNSVFASTTLPVSVNVRGTNLNQVYIGVFRPDAAKAPRWMGNLKMYKLAATNNVVFLADANNARAENSNTGFIANTATSFWTSQSCFWSFRGADPNSTATLPGSCAVTEPAAYPYWSDKPDGDNVEKGGAAQRLRINYPTSQATRKVYTCTAASGGICAAGDSLSATPFSAGGTGYPADNTNILAADLGAYTTYSVSSLTNASATATVQLAGTSADWPSPFFSNGNTVRIEGASPTNFNGDFTIANVDATNGRFEYTLTSFFGGRTAIVTAANHRLNAGDKVKATSGVPTGYNTPFNNTDCGSADPYPITLISTSQFSYRMCNPATSAATTLPVLVGYKTGTELSGSGTSATLSLPNHGFSGTTVAISIDTAGGNTSFDTSIDVTANIVNANTLTYTTPTTITGTASTAKVTATAHGLKVGDMLTVTGSTNGYNCAGTCPVVSVIDANTFTYTPPTAISAAATGTISISATRTFVNTIALTNGSGGSRNLVTATAPGGTTLDVNDGNSPTNWKATVSGAVDAGFNVSLANVTSSSTSVATFNVASGGAPAANSTASTKGTLAFTRNAFAPNVVASVIQMVPVVSYTGTINVKKTITGVTSVSARNSATGAITAGRTSDGNATLRAQIINWVLGRDNAEGENPPGTAPAASTDTDVRASVHGDVLHSRPAVVNYNRQANSDDDIYVFYGGNDGMLRALKGGAAATTVEPLVNPGDERWAFIPREFFPKFKRLRNNSPAISSALPRDYTADGPIGVYVLDAVKADGSAGSDGKLSAGVTGPGGEVDKVHIFYAFRRGGRFLYALDVTDPAAPKFLWRKTSSNTGFSELGYTWSEPKVAKLRIDVSGTVVTKTVLVLGGGYDPSIDDVNSCLLEQSTLTGITIKPIGTGTISYTAAGSCVINNPTGSSTPRSRSMGRAIYVLDAADGSIIWQAGPTAGASPNATVSGMCAIPSDITTVDIDRDGYIERGYVGDTCGNLWRMDISATLPANWTVTKIGSVSSTTATDIPNKRKFLFPPDVVFSTDTTGAYAAILLGSGDREHPFDTNTVDRFYMFKDRTVSGVYNTLTTCSGAAVTDPILDSNLYDATNQAVVAGDPLSECGFKLTFAAGEKNVGASVTIAGSTFFNTNQPSSTAGGGACSSNLGIARQYVIDFEDASATHDLSGAGGITLSDRSQTYGQGGFLPSPVPAIVDIDGKRYQVVISGTSISTPEAAALDTRIRTYWYKEFD